MAKKKKNRNVRSNRAVKKEYHNNNEFFKACCETFVNVLLAEMFNWESETVKSEFDRVDKIWREKARSIINNDLIKYCTPDLRKNLTNNFSVFIDNLKSRPLKDLNPVKEEETSGTLSEIKVILYDEAKSINEHPETIGMIMRENGINTHAKTHVGLKRVFDGLSYEQQVKICESLESIKCS